MNGDALGTFVGFLSLIVIIYRFTYIGIPFILKGQYLKSLTMLV